MNDYTITDLIILLGKKYAELEDKKISTSTEAIYVAAQLEVIGDIVDELSMNNVSFEADFNHMVAYQRERMSEEGAV